MSKLAPFPEEGKAFVLWASGTLGRISSVDNDAQTVELKWASDEDGTSTSTWTIEEYRSRADLVTQEDFSWPARL